MRRLLLLLVMALFAGCVIYLRMRRNPPGNNPPLCPQCRHPLPNISSPRCPACGENI